MKRLLTGITLALTVTIVSAVRAQAPWQMPPQQAQWPPRANPTPYYAPFNDLTPSDAYRDHQINRWELEQYEGPLPPALQGPSPNGRGEGMAGG